VLGVLGAAWLLDNGPGLLLEALAGGTLTAGRTGQHGFRLHLELPG
jgi:hypothetical protein